jgi:hypothetical protein
MDIDTDRIDDAVLALLWFHDSARVEVFRLGRDRPAAHEGADPRSGRQSQVGGSHAGGPGPLGATVPGTICKTLTRLAPRSRRLGPLPDCLPLPGQQLVQPVLGQVVDPGQHIGEPRLRIDIVHLGGGDEAEHGSLATPVRSGEQPCLSAMDNPDKGFSDCGFELIAGLKVALGLDRVDLVGGNGRDDVNEGVDDGSMLIEGRELLDIVSHVPGLEQGFILQR